MGERPELVFPLSKKKKFRFISDLTKEKSLDFIVLLETGRKSFTSPFLKNLYACRDYLTCKRT
jgi:hypothetical protein